MKGGTLKENNPLTTQETTTRLYTLELPVLARLHLCDIYFNAGPSIAYNLAGKVKTDDPETGIMRSKIAFDGSPNAYKRWEAGLQVGAGYEFKIKQSRLVVDVRYHYGLTNLDQAAEKYNRYFNVNMLWSKPWKKNPFAKKQNI